MKPPTPLDPLVQLARQTAEPVCRLDAMLVPLSHGLMDSHGHVVGDPAEIRTRLAVVLADAQRAIHSAIASLNAQNERKPDAVQSPS